MSPTEESEIEALQEAFNSGAVTGSFASSLLSQFSTKGFLSEKQMYYVRKLVTEGNGTAGRSVTAHIKGPAAETVDASALFNLFRKAETSRLAYPSIRYRLPDGSNLRCYPAGESSRYQGQILFTNGATYPGIVRYAILDQAESTLRYFHSAPPDSPTAHKIRSIIADPVKAAVLTGKQLGSCCFCSRELENEFSVTHGYGPICAQKWGLPWIATHGGTTQLSISLDDNDKGELQT